MILIGISKTVFPIPIDMNGGKLVRVQGVCERNEKSRSFLFFHSFIYFIYVVKQYARASVVFCNEFVLLSPLVLR